MRIVVVSSIVVLEIFVVAVVEIPVAQIFGEHLEIEKDEFGVF